MAFGVAEPCNRLRKDGGALSERSKFAPTPGSANRAGNPKGHDTAKFLHGASRRARPLLGPFAKTKGPRQMGRGITLGLAQKIA